METTRTSTHVRMTADQYDRMAVSDDNPWDALLIERLVEEARERPPGRRLLDVGTGTAVLLVKLCAVPPFDRLELVGSDHYPDMVERARRRVAEAGLSDRIAVERQDAHDLSYPDGWADWVVSRSTIHHWADPVRALRELARVLAPGGVALVHDIRRDPAPAAVQRFNAMRRAAGIGPSLLAEKYTPHEVRGMCEEAGIAAWSRVVAPEDGPGALGFELRIAKPS